MKRPRDASEEFDHAMNFVRKVKARFCDEPEKFSSFGKILKQNVISSSGTHDGVEERLSDIPGEGLARVNAILAGHNDLIQEFSYFLPQSPQIGLDNGYKKETSKAAEIPTIRDAVERNEVNNRQNENSENIKTCQKDDKEAKFVAKDGFLVKGSESRETQVNDQRNKNPENIAGDQNNDMEAKIVAEDGFLLKNSDPIPERIREGYSFLEKVEKRLLCQVSYETFLKVLFFYNKRKFGKAELENMVATLIGEYPDLMCEFKQFWRNCQSVSVIPDEANRENKEQKLEAKKCIERGMKIMKNMDRSIEELDISECKRCTASYLLLPKKHTYNTTEDESQVLNEFLVARPSKTNGSFSKHRIKNQHERALFKCEDDQYELEMSVEWFTSAVKYAKKLEEGCDEDKIEEGNRTIFLRCIERLYGDNGLQVLEMFRDDPRRTLPVLIMRLNQKLYELTTWHENLKRTWANTYAKNLHKSLGL